MLPNPCDANTLNRQTRLHDIGFHDQRTVRDDALILHTKQTEVPVSPQITVFDFKKTKATRRQGISSLEPNVSGRPSRRVKACRAGQGLLFLPEQGTAAATAAFNH